jgi:dTDP-glucose pyrophosphorylase
MIRVIIFNTGINFNEDEFKSTLSQLKSRGYTLYAVDNISTKDLNRKIQMMECQDFLRTHSCGGCISIKDHYINIISECLDTCNILVVDNDYTSITIAQKLGLRVCLKSNGEDLVKEILSTVDYYQDPNRSLGKRTLFKKSINIVVPIMGDNTRFTNSMYMSERNMIPIYNKPVLTWVLDNLQIDANYIFVIREHLCRLHKIDKILESLYPGCTIVKSEKRTEGNACSILLAEQYINNTNPLIVVNDNQWLEWDVERYITEFLLNETSLVQMITFCCCGDNTFHYIETNSSDKIVTRIHLFKPVNEWAITDVYFWRHGEDFVKYSHRMNSQNKRLVGEFCTTLVINEVFDDITTNKIPQGSVIHRICDKYFRFSEAHNIPEFIYWYADNKLIR